MMILWIRQAEKEQGHLFLHELMNINIPLLGNISVMPTISIYPYHGMYTSVFHPEKLLGKMKPSSQGKSTGTILRSQ